MEKTAKSAAMRETRKEICKLRVQSTPKEIENFHRFMKMCDELGLCEVINFSDMFFLIRYCLTQIAFDHIDP